MGFSGIWGSNSGCALGTGWAWTAGGVTGATLRGTGFTPAGGGVGTSWAAAGIVMDAAHKSAAAFRAWFKRIEEVLDDESALGDQAAGELAQIKEGSLAHRRRS